MKRFHVHVSVDDLAGSIRFYSTLFGTAPAVEKPDYAKWMIEDPRINFAISRRGRHSGINHLGLQVDSGDELEQLRSRLVAAEQSLDSQTGAACCYARSDKHWVTDPSGIAWETFHTLDSLPVFGSDSAPGESGEDCCVPAAGEAARPAGKCGAPVSQAAGKSCCS